MDYNKRHFERFSCRICALTITELLHLTFTRKTSSFSARLSSHAAKPNTTFPIVITRTPCAVTCVATETHKNMTKPQGSSLCKQNCHVPHALVNRTLTVKESDSEVAKKVKLEIKRN